MKQTAGLRWDLEDRDDALTYAYRTTENQRTVNQRTITRSEYESATNPYQYSTPLNWNDFKFIIKVLVMADDNQDYGRIHDAFSRLDRDGSNRLSVIELRKLVSGATHSKDASKFLAVFDRNGDGYIDRNEFQQLILNGDSRRLLCGEFNM